MKVLEGEVERLAGELEDTRELLTISNTRLSDAGEANEAAKGQLVAYEGQQVGTRKQRSTRHPPHHTLQSGV
jgi:hypothetical protein